MWRSDCRLSSDVTNGSHKKGRPNGRPLFCFYSDLHFLANNALQLAYEALTFAFAFLRDTFAWSRWLSEALPAACLTLPAISLPRPFALSFNSPIKRLLSALFGLAGTAGRYQDETRAGAFWFRCVAPLDGGKQRFGKICTLVWGEPQK